jgi:lysophospholipase L1-like esterase
MSRATSIRGAYGALALLTLNTLLLLALVEGAAALVEAVRPRKDPNLLSFAYSPYRMLKSATAPWPINSDGFRARELSTYDRSRFTVLFLGGSVCVGWGGENGDPLSALVEAELHRRGLTRAQVINLGQGGAVSRQELDILVDYGLPLHPRVVVSFNGANDWFHPLPMGNDRAPNLPNHDALMRGLWERNEKGPIAALVDHSHAVSVLQRVRERMARDRRSAGSEAVVPIDDVVSSYFTAMDHARALLEPLQATHIVAIQPTAFMGKSLSPEEEAFQNATYSPFQVDHARRLIARVRERARIRAQNPATPTYDLSDALAGEAGTLYLDSVHFGNAKGYPLLLQALVQQGFFDEVRRVYEGWERSSASVAGS